MSNIGEFGAQVLSRPDLGQISRWEGVEGFMSLFRPGRIVDLAFASNDASSSKGITAIPADPAT